MTVYVDDMYKYPMGEFGRMKMSHMIADTEEELHQMADKIGVARKWYQRDHYDISISKRVLAIECGAVPVTMKELSQMVMRRRKRPTLKRAAARKAIRAKAAALTTVLKAIFPWREKNKGKNVQEVVKCPVCEGKLHLRIAASNGHVWGQCETEGCVAWME